MYAVVTTGGKQYRVEAGSELIIEQLGAETGASITFDRVLLVGDGDAVTVGTPTVDGASVSATVLGESLGPKLIIFKFKQKATYRRKNGHRQHMIRVRIDEINASGKKAKSKTADAPDEADADVKSEAKADAPEKPKRTRKPAAKAAEAKADAPEKPKRTRKPAAKKTESEE
jgi:large subunit ribosomal protein L21